MEICEKVGLKKQKKRNTSMRMCEETVQRKEKGNTSVKIWETIV